MGFNYSDDVKEEFRDVWNHLKLQDEKLEFLYSLLEEAVELESEIETVSRVRRGSALREKGITKKQLREIIKVVYGN